MQTIEVKRHDLLEKVKQNREEHRAMFLAAQEKYREAMIRELDQRLAEVRAGKSIRRAFSLPEPVDYTNTYDQAIKALEWDVREVVELDQRTFNQLVLNDWEWKRDFAANTGSYLVE